jgi:excisionase family DNA binding protein
MENNIDHPLTLTVEQAAKVLGIGRSTAYELVHTGDIPSLRLGRRIVVPVAHVAVRLGVGRDAVWAVLTGAAASAPSSPPPAVSSAVRGGSRPSSTNETPSLF